MGKTNAQNHLKNDFFFLYSFTNNELAYFNGLIFISSLNILIIWNIRINFYIAININYYILIWIYF